MGILMGIDLRPWQGDTHMSTLFATTIASAKAKERPYKMFDGGGLHLFVKPNGSKLWRLTYSWLGKQKTMALGQWPELSLADARDKRDEARRLLALGVDPSHQQKVDAAKARIEDDNTFKAVAKEWIAKQEREEMAEITANELLLVPRSLEAAGRYEASILLGTMISGPFRPPVFSPFACAFY